MRCCIGCKHCEDKPYNRHFRMFTCDMDMAPGGIVDPYYLAHSCPYYEKENNTDKTGSLGGNNNE